MSNPQSRSKESSELQEERGDWGSSFKFDDRSETEGRGKRENGTNRREDCTRYRKGFTKVGDPEKRTTRVHDIAEETVVLRSVQFQVRFLCRCLG